MFRVGDVFINHNNCYYFKLTKFNNDCNNWELRWSNGLVGALPELTLKSYINYGVFYKRLTFKDYLNEANKC